MTKGRMEAFGDAVIAIIITIMVLELHVPEDPSWAALAALAPKLLSYLLSFVILATYWNNHHHMFQAVDRVNGRVLWANLHLLFWLSLVPFATAWLGETSAAETQSVALYGIVMVFAAVSYYILVHTLVSVHGKDSRFAVAIGQDWKGKLSVVVFSAAVLLAFILPLVAVGLYTAVAAVWLIPDPRFEKALLDAAR